MSDFNFVPGGIDCFKTVPEIPIGFNLNPTNSAILKDSKFVKLLLC